MKQIDLSSMSATVELIRMRSNPVKYIDDKINEISEIALVNVGEDRDKVKLEKQIKCDVAGEFNSYLRDIKMGLNEPLEAINESRRVARRLTYYCQANISPDQLYFGFRALYRVARDQTELLPELEQLLLNRALENLQITNRLSQNQKP